MDCILADAGISLVEAAALCRNRDSWRHLIHKITSRRRRFDGTQREQIGNIEFILYFDWQLMKTCLRLRGPKTELSHHMHRN